MKKNYIIFNHIEELKYRFFYIFLSLIISSITFYSFLGELTYVVIKPLFVNENYEIQELIYTDMSEAFFASMKLTLFFSCFANFSVSVFIIF